VPDRPSPVVTTRPLVVADDADLVDDLLRLAAAACVEVEVVPDAVAARPPWTAASVILVGADLARECVRARLPRRSGVVVVAGSRLSPDNETVWTVATELGAEHVVFLPAAERWVVDRLAHAAAGSRPEGRLVAVVGGRGGAGASVLAAALAVTAVRCGRRALLVDVDPYGGGLDLVLGGEEAAGLRWPDLAGTSGRISGPALHAALPVVGELCVLSWDRGDVLEVPPDAVEAVVEAGRRDSELVVADLPRRPDEAAIRVLQAADLVLLVIPAEVRACAAAARVALAMSPHCADLRLVVRGPAPAGLRSRDLARVLALPLAGIMRAEPGLAAALERGEAPGSRGSGPLARLARKVLAQLDVAPVDSAA
jgi:secretion/DNA translocation related CpaE-like protein